VRQSADKSLAVGILWRRGPVRKGRGGLSNPEDDFSNAHHGRGEPGQTPRGVAGLSLPSHRCLPPRPRVRYDLQSPSSPGRALAMRWTGASEGSWNASGFVVAGRVSSLREVPVAAGCRSRPARILSTLQEGVPGLSAGRVRCGQPHARGTLVEGLTSGQAETSAPGGSDASRRGRQALSRGEAV
jgi:hypothetical protein